MSTQQFFFNFAAELVQIAEADLRINVMTVDDGEMFALKVTGIDKDGKNTCIRVEDEEGDEFYIFIDHIISITPVESDEEDEGDALEDEDEVEDTEEAA